jgi:hypothetical protein
MTRAASERIRRKRAMTGWRRVWTLPLALIALAAMGVPSAQAQQGKHCAYRLDPVSKTGHVTLAEPVLIGCYATFAEAISAGTSGNVTVDPSMTPDRVTDADLTRTDSRGAVLIGTEFLGTGYGGDSNTYSALLTCSALNTWEVAYVGDAWNDKFSSGKGFGGCDHNKKFAASNFGGNVLTCTPNCTNYGDLSNEVSSLRWKP